MDLYTMNNLTLINDKTKKWKEILFFAIIALFTFVFFVGIHPLIIFDTDDWLYIYYSRKAIPLLNIYNPGKVLPEILMPLTSEISSHLLYPVTNDFISSQKIGHAIMVTLFVFIYLFSFYRLCHDRFCHSRVISMYITVLFYLLHFLPFRIAQAGNIYLLNAHNVNCYYNYVIPALLNASIVMFIMKESGFDCFHEMSLIKKGFCLLFIYLAIFSNLFLSIILASYAFADIVINWKGTLRNKKNQCIVLGAWVLAAFCELLGGRSRAIKREDINIFNEIGKTIKHLFDILINENQLFLLIVLVSTTIIIYYMVKNKLDIIGFIVALLITVVFEVLLCAVTGYTRISRPDVMIAFYFFILALIGISLSVFLAEYKKLIVVAPLFLLIVFFEINTEGVTFVESNTPNINSKCAEAISRDIVMQIVNVDNCGESEMTLIVPKWDSEDNWPHALYAEERFIKALQKNGVISHKIIVHMLPSEEEYKKYLGDIKR